MLTQGWIKLHRSIQESPVFNDGEPYTRREAWIWILMNANVRDNVSYYGFNRIEIKRGQILTSVRNLAVAWHRSKDWTGKVIDLFVADGMLEKVRTPCGTLLTIVNYGIYQDCDSEVRTLHRTDSGHFVGHFADTSQDISKKDKKAKKDKEEKNITPIVPFAQFWEVYPKKVGKDAAIKAFKKINPDEALMQTILEAVGKQKLSRQWQENGGQYIPYPATWLNGHRWEDEIETTRTGLASAVGKPSRNDYDQRENTEPDMDAVPQWLKEYQEQHPTEYQRIMKGETS